MDNILIIKTGAAGDVVRTTSLLNVLEGNIYWVTAEKNMPLLPDAMPNLSVLSIGEASRALQKIKFNQVISLEENGECARLATEINKNELAGIYLEDDKISYTDNSASWFDMSRVSKFGLTKANQLKKENAASYQHHIFKMTGKKFNDEPYRIFTDSSVTKKEKLIGIESRTGDQWPDKQWWGYEELAKKLEAAGYAVRFFKQQGKVRDYLGDIAECSYIVSGDTLAMHVALAYRKRCTAIFNCTSPQEIYDYGFLKKIVSPLLDRFFYATSLDRQVIGSVTIDEVYKSIID